MSLASDRHERRVFEAALERSDEDREAYLHEACAQEPEFERRVRRLLQAHERAARTATQALEGGAEDLDYPERIGPYRLLERIGEGGMGVVYAAEQAEPVRRKVALKLVKAGMDTREVIARFHSERQALALMNHPNIARILEAGATDWGRPYFVMEYVPGMPLLEYCDRQNLDVPQRLQLFTQVCAAVQHAHQKGVIHRDLKPSNIIIQEEDGRQIPKVIDFGVAKAVGQRLSDLTVYTRLGGFIGTPEYVSPEQAKMTGLDVDTRADVYSLGAVLYELLAGVRPFDFSASGLSLVDIQKTIFEQDPPLPSLRVAGAGEDAHQRSEKRRVDPPTLSRTLRHDLDWIVMRALEKDRNRRYPSASELAADIERFLADQPVAAGPQSVRYRLKRFVSRHRGLLMIGGVSVVLLIAGILGTTLGLLQARREAARARVQTAIATEINNFLNQDLLAAVAPERQGIEVSMREVLDAAAQRIEGRFPDQPLVEASLRQTIGHTYKALGIYPAAEPHYLRAIEIRRQTQGPEHSQTLGALAEFTSLLENQARYDEAEPLLLDLVEARRRLVGDEDPRTLANIANLATLYVAMGRYGEAEQLYLECLQTRERLRGRDHPTTVRVIENLAVLYQYMQRWDEAEQLHLEAQERMVELYGEEGPATLNALINLSALYLRQERYPEAQAVLERSLPPMRRVLGAEHPRTLKMANNLGYLYTQLGRFDDAESLLLESLEGHRQVLGDEHLSTLNVIDSLIDLYRTQGAPEPLAAYNAEYFRIRERLAKKTDATPNDLRVFAELLLSAESHERRDPASAVVYASRANEATARRDPRKLETLARAYFHNGETSLAIDTLRQAITAVPEGPSTYLEKLEATLAQYTQALDR